MVKVYEKYKDSGQNYLGEIPSHWKTVKLKYIGEAITGITYSPNDVVDNEKGLLVLRSSNIQDGKLSLADNVFVDKNINDKHLTKLNDILLCSRNGSRHLIGKNILIDEKVVNQTWGAFMTVYRTQHSKFAYYFFNSPIFDALSSLFLSSTINQLTIGVINNFILALPPKEEQTQIATYLDYHINLIDQLIAKKETLIQKLQEQRQAIINEAVTKGLNPDVEMKDSGIDWLGKIPKHWDVVPLTKYLSSIVDYRGKTPKKTDNGNFLVTARNIKNGKIDYSISQEYVDKNEYEQIMSRGLPKVGDVLFTTEAPLGEVANVDNPDIALAQRIIKFRTKSNHCNNFFLKYWLISQSFQYDLKTYATGSTALGIKASKLPNLKLIMPPINEQLEIVKYLDKQIELFELKEIKIFESIHLIQEYRQSLISEAVTGKIDVRDWQHSSAVGRTN